jgi:hypothetical protein
MKLSEIKEHLITVETVNFKLPTGENIPAHFHITEVGLVSKHFIDCGGTERFEKIANFQLWRANDLNHRLQPQKLLSIIALSEKILGKEDLEIEVEYQSDTIGKYGLHFNAKDFMLIPKQTACLAQDSCSIPVTKQKISLAILQEEKACCSPGGCC